MKSAHRIGIVIVGLLLGMEGGPLFHEPLLSAAPESPTRIREAAVLEPVGSTDLSNTTGVKTRILYIAPVGKTVEKGGLVAELDAAMLQKKKEDYRAQVEKTNAGIAATKASMERAAVESQARLKVAELRLSAAQGAKKTFLEGEFPLEVKGLEQDITLTEEVVTRAKMQYEKLKQIQENEEVIQPLQEAQLTLVESQGKLSHLQARLQFLKTLLHAQRTTELDLAIAERQLELIQVRNRLDETKEKGEAQLSSLQKRQKTELQRLARLEEQINASKVYAPKEGRVLYPKKGLKPGMIADDRQVLLRIVDRHRFDMNVRVALSAARRLVTGQTAPVTVDAFPEQTFTGRIVRTRVLSEQSEPDQALVTVRVDDPSGKIRNGMSCRVEFTLGDKE